jgi:hypothetical protein
MIGRTFRQNSRAGRSCVSAALGRDTETGDAKMRKTSNIASMLTPRTHASRLISSLQRCDLPATQLRMLDRL